MKYSKTTLAQLVGMVVLVLPFSLFAETTPSPVEQKAQSCSTCHGVDGVAVLDIAPNLAGQKALYTKIQLQAYRSGERNHQVMSIIAKPLTDEDIEMLSEYYATLGVKSTDASPAGECKPDDAS